MALYLFGWPAVAEQTVTVDAVARELNRRLGALDHDLRGGAIAVTGRATTFTQPLTVRVTTGPQLTVAYSASVKATMSISSAGTVTLDTAGSSPWYEFVKPLVVTVAPGPQLFLAYDASNYMTIKVASNGAVTIDAIGSGAAFTFSDDVNLASGKVLKVNGTQVVTAQQSGIGTAIPSRTAGAIYAGTEQTMLQEAHDKARLLESALRTHGLVTT